MKMTMINGLVYGFLEKFQAFQDYFSTLCPYIASICVMMTIGMGVWKLMWDCINAKEFFVKLFMNICIYLVMIYLYPIVMKGVLSFGMNLGYGAVFEGGAFKISFTEKEKKKGLSEDGFYQWVSKYAGGMFKVSDKEDEEEAVRKAFQINIIDRKTGYIDLNKIYCFPMAFFQIMMKCTLPMPSLTNWVTLIVPMILVLITSLLFIVVLVTVLINYITCLLDYFALSGFGILLVPLSLWDGTKEWTQTLIGSIGKILIKLMVISAILFLDVMVIPDIFLTLYRNTSDGAVVEKVKDIVAIYPICINLIFQSVFMYMASKETSAIAGFITGGSPQMSFGEFARSAVQTMRNTAQGAMMGAAAGKAVGNAGAAIGNAIQKGQTQAGTTRALGGSKGDAFKAGLGAGAGAIGKSLLGTASGAVGKAGSALSKFKNSPSQAVGAMAQGANGIAQTLGFEGGMSAEGISGLPFMGGKNGGSFGGGSSEGGSGVLGNKENGSSGGSGSSEGVKGDSGSKAQGALGGASKDMKENALNSALLKAGGNAQGVKASGGESSSSGPSVESSGGLDFSNNAESKEGGSSSPSLQSGGENSSSGGSSSDVSSSSGSSPLTDGGSGVESKSLGSETPSGKDVDGSPSHIESMEKQGLLGPYGAVDEKHAMNESQIQENQGLGGFLSHVGNVMKAEASGSKEDKEDSWGKFRQFSNLSSQSNDPVTRGLGRLAGGITQMHEKREMRRNANEVKSNFVQAQKDYKETGVENPQAVNEWNSLSGKEKELSNEKGGLKGFMKDMRESVSENRESAKMAKLNSNGGFTVKTGNKALDKAEENAGGLHVSSIPKEQAGGETGRFAVRFNNGGISEADNSKVQTSFDVAAVRAGKEKPFGNDNSSLSGGNNNIKTENKDSKDKK